MVFRAIASHPFHVIVAIVVSYKEAVHVEVIVLVNATTPFIVSAVLCMCRFNMPSSDS